MELEKPLSVTDVRSVPDLDLAALERRFSRVTPPISPEAVTCEFTNDPALLEQYYLLRREVYVRAWELDHFPLKDEYDRNCHTLIMRLGRQCVGGVRMILRTPRSRTLLPMEAAGVDLHDALPGINLEYQTYGEISRMARLPDYRGFNYTLLIHGHLRRKAHALGMRYGFMLSPAANARMYRRVGHMTRDGYHVLEHIHVPQREEYEGIRMMASCIDYGVPEAENAVFSQNTSVQENEVSLG